ncbi:hypothetical protein CBM2615_B150107 [Cupriavidus taiwanensis]|uniref:Uncharacterized protein n=1 Tax=Cupriavidus taiwanensis TaxID=164546 RepID=A0A375EB24_9BURK|nr:hypothetical protein CBM2614_B160110 [Cupriavidus taiwanensis]SOZ65132.1 hypothetical protein CBM2615_B150107 [Cupriavidus taiwanensis]SOZ68801.1 hypothetical protein CBM2613_B120107 [Cupriavidus taiwanensis]SPA08227.1 hypothetical protein CBM2625_B120106 [Cupriavidus taiwanensis]
MDILEQNIAQQVRQPSGANGYVRADGNVADAVPQAPGRACCGRASMSSTGAPGRFACSANPLRCRRRHTR